jgi:glycosyltransferase involved in cell wall biosynthesis
VIRNLPETMPEVVSIDLLRNSGQHSAVFCGIEHARGDYIVTMDDDLQNPPTELGKLIETIHEGYDLVFARFEQKQHSLFRCLGSRMVGYLNYKIFNKPKDITLTNFRIFTSAVARRMLRGKVQKPYIPGQLLNAARRIGNVATRHEARPQGESNYTLLKIFSLLASLLFNYSSFPLRLLSRFGGAMACSARGRYLLPHPRPGVSPRDHRMASLMA